MFIHSLAVGVGGFLGALLRYGTSVLVLRHFPSATFPWATFSVNLVGRLLIGVVAGFAESKAPVPSERECSSWSASSAVLRLLGVRLRNLRDAA